MSVSEPPPSATDQTRAGLEPEQFQKRLVAVTLTVLLLGIAGGTCLGYKIKRAEEYQQFQEKREAAGAASSEPSSGSKTPGEQAASSGTSPSER